MRSHIPHDKMGIGTGGNDSLASIHEACCNSSRISDHLGAVSFEFRGRNLLELDCQRTNLVVMRTSLEHGEYSEVYFVSKFFLAENDA